MHLPGLTFLLLTTYQDYFENYHHYLQVCLNAPACERAWIYERALGYMLEGHDDRVIGEVTKIQRKIFMSTFLHYY